MRTHALKTALFFTILTFSGCSQTETGGSETIQLFDPPSEAIADAGLVDRVGPQADSSVPTGGATDDLGVPVDAAVVDTGDDPDSGPADSVLDSEKSCDDVVYPSDVYGFSARSVTTDEEVSLCDYAGDVLLIVNTAANCGFTPQYTGLENLHRRFINRPLKVLGFLSNDFGEQGGTLDEVEDCTEAYMLSFEQFHHVGVTSTSRDGQHPLFRWLTTQAQYSGEIRWNFTKFLVSHDGEILGRWDSLVTPDDPDFQSRVDTAVERAELWQQ